MSVPLFERQPGFCPFGHLLGPGWILVGWSPCICQAAKEAAGRGRGLGHARLHCLACETEGRTATYYEPPHDLRQWHVR
jgi:hypothetical protein